MLVSTLANAEFKENRIYCSNGSTYTMTDFTLDGNSQKWTGLISTKAVHAKIPASPANVYDCASGRTNNIAARDEYGLTGFAQGLSSTNWITFKCFCKLRKDILNNCATWIEDGPYADVPFPDYYIYAHCKDGEAKTVKKEYKDHQVCAYDNLPE